MSLVDRERDHLKYLKYKCEEQRAATDGSDRVALEETEAKIRRQERKLKCHEDMARILLLASKNAAKDSTDRPREVSPAAATATKNASDYAGRQSPEYSRYSLNARNNANSIPFMDHVTTNVAHMKMPGEETTDNSGIGESFSEDSSALAPHKKRRNSDLDRSDYDDVSLIVICQSVYNNGSAWVIAPNAANEFYRLMGNKRHKYADARDKAVAKGYMECKRRSGGHPACHLQLTPIGTSFVKHAFLFYLCRAIRSLAPSSEWVLETKVDAPFYNNARKLKPEEGKFGEARSQAMSMGLVELGRVATGIPSKPIIKCTCDQSTTGYYLRLTSLGMAFLQQPNKPIETLSSDLRKRKFAALDSDDSRAKRRGNPIVMNDGTLPPQAPTAAKFTAAPIENPKEAKKPDAVDNISVVLGGVAKYTVTDGAEQDKDLSCSDDVLFILDSIDVIGDKWVKNGDAAREFYRKLGNPNKPRFRDARDEATHAGFIEWGRHDLSDPKRAVVVQKDRLERKSMSVNSYLRLTSLGRNVLESQRTFKSTSKAQPGEDNRNYPKLSKGGKFWFVSKSGAPRTVCHFFSGASGAGCRKGRECGFLHVQPPPSRKKLKDPRLVPIRLPIHEICYYEEDDATGRSWVTAAFHDRSSNIYYKAAGDRSGQKDSDGIWWYQTREEARKALERAISASLY